jgi:serine/threonine-protein kinase
MSAPRYLPAVLLATGGTAQVHLGVLLGAAGFRRPIVLKRVSPSARDPEHARRALVREGLIASALNHPHVIHVYELLDTSEGLALAMEYVPGASLGALIAAVDGPLPWPIAARIAADAARGLDHAHHALGSDGAPLGIVHRDVTPQNVLVTEDGITKVVDFGIARTTLRAETITVAVRGTAAYVSPEQARGRPLDARSDVFSLGVVLHELLAGVHPFARGGPEKTMAAIASAAPPPLPEAIPALVREVAGRMLAKDPALRRVTMAEVADALDGAAASRGGTHREVATFLRAELGEPLAARRRLVAEVLAGGTIAARPLPEDAGTLAMLEAVLDQARVSVSSEHAPIVAEEATDTVLDDGSSTVIDPAFESDTHVELPPGRPPRRS